MIMINRVTEIVICLSLVAIHFSFAYSQDLDVAGKIRIGDLGKDSSLNVVVWKEDSTLAYRYMGWPMEYQVLSISSDTLFLTNGGFVKLPNFSGWIISDDSLSTSKRVGIGTTNPKAALEVNGPGFIPPRLSNTERDALAKVQPGTMIFNTQSSCTEIFRGAAWYNLCKDGYVSSALNTLLGGESGDFANSIEVTSDGGFIIAGYSHSSVSGDVGDNNNGRADYWIVKVNALGEIQWEKLIGGSLDDYAESIIQTSDGGYLVAGYSLSSASGDVSETNNGDSDYWIVKLSETGNVIWNRLIGGSKEEKAYEVIETLDGGYAVVGHSESSESGDVTGISNGILDYWIVKLDGLGNIEWNNLLGADLVESANGIVQTSDGGYYVVGLTYGGSFGGDITVPGNGGDECWLVKLDGSGAMQWNKLMGGNADETGIGIVNAFNDEYIIAARSKSSSNGDVSGTNNGNLDYWIIKIDTLGVILWDKLVGGSGDDLVHSIAVTPDGGVVAVGQTTSSASGDVSETSNGYIDSWIVKIDGAGNLVWENLFGGIVEDIIYSIKTTLSANYVVAGYSRSSASGDVINVNNGVTDFWIVAFDVNGMIID